ncbi:uncharacterized protein LOC131886018 [Tigriopus californicus]|uniref:uncharacterized protein LOC131886018 n=1 Tax=Tigriopus californicus TaxID=6832 RepID=UPI0027DAA660|nr:uncharacterized protein LOC131886018 [Tigriopus californicus]
MSEKYYTIGVPMNALPRPQTSSNYSRIESALNGQQSSNGNCSVKFHDCSLNASLTNIRDLNGLSIRVSSANAALQICTLGKDDLVHSKDAKFSSGTHLSCPYIGCNFKNSQFQSAGKFPAEFLLNHLHSNHRHRRFNGDTLDLTMVVPQLETEVRGQSQATQTSKSNNVDATQTWPFVEIYSHKRHFYLEVQSFTFDGFGELFLWLWFLGPETEELHYRYQLMVIHGKSEYSYKGPVISMTKSAQDIRTEGRCLVIRERVWDYISYKLKITKH